MILSLMTRFITIQFYIILNIWYFIGEFLETVWYSVCGSTMIPRYFLRICLVHFILTHLCVSQYERSYLKRGIIIYHESEVGKSCIILSCREKWLKVSNLFQLKGFECVRLMFEAHVPGNKNILMQFIACKYKKS